MIDWRYIVLFVIGDDFMNIKMQCCGMVLMVIILYFYLCRRKIKLRTSQAFVALCNITLISLVLDVLSVIMITLHDSFSEAAVDIVCKGYLASLLILVMLAYFYVFTDICGDEKRLFRNRLTSYFITAVGIVTLFLLPIEKYLDEDNNVYTYGPSAICTYVFAAYYMFMVVLMLIVHYKEMTQRRRNAMWVWFAIWAVAILIQFFIKQLLLVGFGASVGVVIVFLMMENPELYTNIRTGIFNHDGMLLYLDRLFKSKVDFSIVHIAFPISLTDNADEENKSRVRIEIIDFLQSVKSAYVFLYKDNEVMIVFRAKDVAQSCLAGMKKCFENGWGKNAATVISPEWIFVPSGNIADKSGDLLQLIEYAIINRNIRRHENVTVVDEEMIDTMHKERSTEKLIIDALEHNRVEVFYQPIYSTEEHRFSAAEALVRIRDEQGRVVPPGVFIDIAEKNGSIMRLGEAVFRKVCGFLNESSPTQFGLEYIEVNLSTVQCSDENLAKRYISIMHEYNIPPSQINLEITESASIEAKKNLLNNMNTLMEYGVKFSLDDFGTGQSNLNYIVEMPVDIVKFDKTMIESYFENGKAKYVMDAAMRMIQGMELSIVSEGIETKEQLDEMIGLGIGYIQGYYFSKPLPEKDFLEFIKKQNISMSCVN